MKELIEKVFGKTRELTLKERELLRLKIPFKRIRVKCADCRYFIPSSYSRNGVGKCQYNDCWRVEKKMLSKLPPYPLAERLCNKYEKKRYYANLS